MDPKVILERSQQRGQTAFYKEANGFSISCDIRKANVLTVPAHPIGDRLPPIQRVPDRLPLSSHVEVYCRSAVFIQPDKVGSAIVVDIGKSDTGTSTDATGNGALRIPLPAVRRARLWPTVVEGSYGTTIVNDEVI